MDVTRITLLGFRVNERGEQIAILEFEPLIGESRDVRVVELRKGDTLTTQLPVAGEVDAPLAELHP